MKSKVVETGRGPQNLVGELDWGMHWQTTKEILCQTRGKLSLWPSHAFCGFTHSDEHATHSSDTPTLTYPHMHAHEGREGVEEEESEKNLKRKNKRDISAETIA